MFYYTPGEKPQLKYFQINGMVYTNVPDAGNPVEQKFTDKDFVLPGDCIP